MSAPDSNGGFVRALLLLAGLSTIGAAAVTVSPTSLAFGSNVVGVPSAVQQVTLTNGSTKALTITSITTGLPDYTQTNTCPVSPSTLAVNASCTISVTFTPTATGTRNDTLRVFDNAVSSPQNVSLTGTAIAAVTATPGSLSYGNQFLGVKSLAQTVTVKNNKTTAVTITSISSNLSDYSFTSTCPLTPGTLAGAGSCTMSVYFTPSALGTRTGTLTTSTNAGANPAVSLTGTGILPAAVSPASMNFAAQALGTTSAPQTVTLTNNQKKTLKITSVVASPSDFADTTTCPLSPSTLAAGASCTASVTFAPKSTGTRTGTLTFTDDATNSPQVVTLSGTGNPPTLLSIAVSPQSASVPAGLTQQLTATGTYSDGSTQNLTNSVTWSSSAAGVASITAAGLATGNAQGTATMTAASGSVNGSSTLTVTAPKLTSIAVTPASPSIAKGISQQLSAIGTYSDGSTLDITTVVTWTTGSAGIATVNGSGLATSVAVGSTTITATSGTVSGSTNLTVTAAALVSIAVTPAVPGLPLGMQQQFAATGTYTDATSQDISANVTWVSSQTGVATITAQGLASAVGIGATNISATLGSITGSTTLTVTPAILVSIAVSPATASIPLGTAQQLTALATFSDGSTQDLTSTVNWSSATPSAVTVAPSGLATSAGVGQSAITAMSGSVSGSATITVTAAQLVSIVVSPPTAAVAAGVSQQFTAAGTFTDGSVQDITMTGHWSSSDATVATVSNTPGMQGLASTLSAGTSTITISSGEISGSATLNVSAAVLVSIAVTPQAAAIAIGNSQQYVAMGTYTDASTQDVTGVVTWSSTNTGVAIISNSMGTNGLATSAGVGTTTVSAALGSVSGSTALTVNPPAAVSLAISPLNPTVPFGGFQQFTATATLSDGSTQDVTGQATWSSSTPAIASVNTTGGATSVGTGASTITASYAGLTTSTSLTVAAPVLVSLTISPSNPTLVVGFSRQLSATGAYSDGSTSDLTSQAQWSSDNPAVENISAAGSVTGLAAGNAVITVALGAITATTNLTVAQADLVSIALTPANASLAKGTSAQLAAIGTYSDGSTLDITAAVSWSTADPGTATISSSGLLTAVAVGPTTITAVSGNVSGSTSLTVTAAALVSISITPGTPSVAAGMQQQFTATGTYTDGTMQDITANVTWSSAQPGVATISNDPSSAGLATGVATGAAAVSATSGTITGTTTLTVTAAVLVSISVSPASPSVALGTTQQFSASGIFSDGTTQDLTGTSAWISSSLTVASIGTTGLASSTGVGSATITATSGNITGTALLTVTPAQLVSIVLNPPSASVAAGTTQQFTALGTFTDGSTQDVTASGHWSSTNASAATVSDTPGSQGLATTFSAGSTTITINAGAASGSAILSVTAAALVSLAITPQSPAITAGGSQQFTASGTYTDKTVQDITAIVTWTSSSAAVAVINSSGLATSSGPGTATISASMGAISGSTNLTVNGAVPVSLAINPQNPSILVGAFQQFTATATLSDSSTQDVSAQAVWSSSMSGVAVVNATGGATALGAGSSTITATYSGLTSSTTLSVTAPVLVSLALAPVNPTVILGTSQQLTATGTYSNGSTSNLTTQVQWNSANTVAATVSGQGIVTAAAAGNSLITATFGSLSATTTVTVTSAIQHVVIIVKQNHSFDHYFGSYSGADGAVSGTLSTGQTLVFPHGSDSVRAEVANDRSSYLAAIDGGKMDRYDIVPSGNISGEYNAFGQLLQSDLPNYWTYATNYVLADRMFASQITAGFANQVAYITGSANGIIDNPANTSSGLPPKWGCDSDPAGIVPVMDSRGVISKVYPCFDFTTIADRLMAAGLTWKYYGPLPGQIDSEWNSFNAISHIRNSSLWTTNVVSDTQFAVDAASGNLPTVSWVMTAKGSEHPVASSCYGENWTVQQINAVMQGPLWNSTAIFVTWDDAGNFFDHVPPPAGPEPFSLGVRVPLLVISPYAKAGYVSHTQYDMTSTLKFVETLFNLPALTTRDESANNMLDNFDFTQAPRSGTVLSTRLCPLVPTSSVVFGPVTVGTSSPTIASVLNNTGATAITISSVSVTGNFTLQNKCSGSLAAGATCGLNLGFSPTTVGSASGNLTVTASDPGSPHVIPLSGIGTNITVSTTGTAFGRTPVGTTSVATLKATLTNQGSTAVSITSIQVIGDFTQTNTCGSSLAAGQSCTVNITFTPKVTSQTGQVYGAVFINHSDPGSPARVLVSGTATLLSVSPSSLALSFASQSVGTTSVSKTIQFTNAGNTAVQFGTVSATGDFAASSACGQSLAPGSTCSVSVTFTPTATGTRTGQVTITDSDITSPQTITTTGTGQ